MKKYISFFIIAIMLIISSGCSNGKTKHVTAERIESKKTQNNGGEKSIKLDPLPTTYEELANLPVGDQAKFIPDSTKSEKTLDTFKDLPDISSNPTKKELDYFYRELLKRVQHDFKGPEDIIRKLKFQSIGDPEVKDPRYQFKQNLNVEIILDSSGSMAQKAGGSVKMDAAKNSIMQFVNQLPDGAKVGLRVFGEKGSNADSDQKVSCESSEMVYPILAKDQVKIQSALNGVKPTGWTPTGLALNEAKIDLSSFDGKNNTNIVYLVSDGISTCNDNPIQAAKDLYHSNISPIINIIGFDVDAKGQNQLNDIANAVNGIYQNVTDESELQKEFDNITNLAKTWKDWREHNSSKIELKRIDNDLDIFNYITEENINETNEGSRIWTILFIFNKEGKIDDKSFDYLEQKNKEYHDWIRSEQDKFNEELKSLNEKGYAEAIQALEAKYQQNAQ